MAVITITSMQGIGQKDVAITTLGASDTFTYKQGTNATLILNNVSGGPLTPLIVGDGAPSAYPVNGAGTIDLTGGELLASIPDGDEVAIKLDTIALYLEGVITLTGGTGIKASLLQY